MRQGRHLAHDEDGLLHGRVELGASRLLPELPDLRHDLVAILLRLDGLEAGEEVVDQLSPPRRILARRRGRRRALSHRLA